MPEITRQIDALIKAKPGEVAVLQPGVPPVATGVAAGCGWRRGLRALDIDRCRVHHHGRVDHRRDGVVRRGIVGPQCRCADKHAKAHAAMPSVATVTAMTAKVHTPW